MQKKYGKLIYILLSIATLNAYSANYQLAYQGSKYDVELNLPTKWQVYKNLFGMPIIFTGPTNNSRRPSISLSPTGLTANYFKPNSLLKSQNSFRDKKEKWITSKQGKLTKFIPYTNFEANNNSIHRIGVNYELKNEKIQDISYYISCNNKIYQMKVLFRGRQIQEYKNIPSKIVRSFKCI